MTEREMDMKKGNDEVMVTVLSNQKVEAKLIYVEVGKERHIFLPRDPEELREIIKNIIWTIYHDQSLYEWLDADRRDSLVTDIIDDISDQQILWESEVGIDPEDE